MAKARAKTVKTKARRSTAHARGGRSQALNVKTAKAVKAAIAHATKASRGKGRNDDMDVHVHVGDVVMMGFDEAVDAEEWGARETTNEFGNAKGRRGGAGRNADPQDEKNRKVHRTIALRKGSMNLTAVERSQPVKKKAAKKAKKAPKKKPRRR